MCRFVMLFSAQIGKKTFDGLIIVICLFNKKQSLLTKIVKKIEW
ncbi:hypothetical protein PROVRETT_06921 [Providencia rettgeri DSM 1131]|nr:hypothetical protein PROVRETT_06921 [Providencia rettgeri DSM 1131]